ncbi:soluble guanylate cyclase gcy-35-like isoform X2 [Mya arenaria]|uniref:soluble guanylate cyclase gcy-35-like isoform X2 n=1 Tax=Mya arenaria TaxID=6604 RepID=UPI0022E190C5|nr:soluble guanylate cyclase gcy-35-like isoform X2 [Mya arenaria]
MENESLEFCLKNWFTITSAKYECPVWSSVSNKSEGKMYGLLLESVQFYVIRDCGEHVWKAILEHAGYKNIVFSTHNTYRDEIMTQLAKSCCHVTKSKDFNQWMTFFGTCFVDFCSGYGYDKLLKVSGRNYRDFLHGIDNIHEVIRFSYPRLQSPAFLVLKEDTNGCALLYQSKRKGFKHYVIGQLQQIAKRFYNVCVDITVMDETIVDNQVNVRFRLEFDNSAYMPKVLSKQNSGLPQFSSISGDIFLKVFPFCIVFNNQLVIRDVGSSLAALLKGDNLINLCLREKFHIRRPLIPCNWAKILQFQRVIFELEYIYDIDSENDLDLEDTWESGVSQDIPTNESTARQRILLRGQMKFIDQWNMIAFLGNPLMGNLQDLHRAGLYINDLSQYDNSRDMVMAGCLHASKLEHSIEQQREKSEKISENMQKIEEWKARSDSLLYAMIPKSVAGKLKSGADPISTCEVFNNVTIMFTYMVGFGDVCSSATPMEIVNIINRVFILFDKIIDKYDVFKVETLGDAVYMVAGGVPDRNPDHAFNVAGLSLELQQEAKNIVEPWQTEYKLKTRIGMHTGSVVGGVVGRRMPQYCLFGDTVNTASRMQTYSLPGRIHISEPCEACLKGTDMVTVLRGTVNVKGKGDMRTYWLAGYVGEKRTTQFIEEVRHERNEAVRKFSSYENAMDLHSMHASTSYAQLASNFGSLRRKSSTSFSHLRLDDISIDEKSNNKLGNTQNSLSHARFLSTSSSQCSLNSNSPGSPEVSSVTVAQKGDTGSIHENTEEDLEYQGMLFFGARPKFTITTPEKTVKHLALSDWNEICKESHEENVSTDSEDDSGINLSVPTAEPRSSKKGNTDQIKVSMPTPKSFNIHKEKSDQVKNRLHTSGSCMKQNIGLIKNPTLEPKQSNKQNTDLKSLVTDVQRRSLSKFRLRLPDMSHLSGLFKIPHYLSFGGHKHRHGLSKDSHDSDKKEEISKPAEIANSQRKDNSNSDMDPITDHSSHLNTLPMQKEKSDELPLEPVHKHLQNFEEDKDFCLKMKMQTSVTEKEKLDNSTKNCRSGTMHNGSEACGQRVHSCPFALTRPNSLCNGDQRKSKSCHADITRNDEHFLFKHNHLENDLDQLSLNQFNLEILHDKTCEQNNGLDSGDESIDKCKVRTQSVGDRKHVEIQMLKPIEKMRGGSPKAKYAWASDGCIRNGFFGKADVTNEEKKKHNGMCLHAVVNGLGEKDDAVKFRLSDE